MTLGRRLVLPLLGLLLLVQAAVGYAVYRAQRAALIEERFGSTGPLDGAYGPNSRLPPALRGRPAPRCCAAATAKGGC